MREKINRKKSAIQDDFATAYNTNLWEEVVVATGAVSISAGALKLNAPVDADCAGLVTKIPYNLRNSRISVSVDASASTPTRCGVYLAQTKVTATNPELEANVLGVCLDDNDNKMTVTTDVAAAGDKTLYDVAWGAESETLVIDIEADGYYTVYEGTTAKFTGTLPFTNTETGARFTFYIYLYCLAVGADVGYALFDNFHVDLDVTSADELRGDGVRKAALMEATPVYGRLVDTLGTSVFFETDHAITDTPTQTITLSRNVKNFRLDEIRYYMNSANAVTSQALLFDEIHVGDDESAIHLIYASSAGLVKGSMYRASTGSHLATGAIVETLDTVPPATFRLETPGQIPFNQDWSAAPGVTKGAIIIIGREVD